MPGTEKPTTSREPDDASPKAGNMADPVEPTTPRESDVASPKGAVRVEYAELTRLVSYGDTLHTERTRFWVMAHAVFVALLGAFVQDLSIGSCLILCVLGILLCICWWLTVGRISGRLGSLNDHIEKHYADSPHAFWLRFWKSKVDAQTKPRRGPTATMIFTWIVPAFFAMAYVALLISKIMEK